MIYLSPDGKAALSHFSCVDSTKGPSLLIRYEAFSADPPELVVYADEGQFVPTPWRRVKEALRILVGGEPRWPDVLMLLGANERDTEVQCVRKLADWLNEKAERYEKDLAEWAAGAARERA